MPPEIVQYRRWVKENFKLPCEKSSSVSLTSSSDSGLGNKILSPKKIDLINSDDFPPLQTANSSSQKERTLSKNLGIENSEIKSVTSAGRTVTSYSSVGAANKSKQQQLHNSTKNTASEICKSGTAMRDMAMITNDGMKEACSQDDSPAGAEEKPKSTEPEPKDVETRDLDSPSDNFIDEFVLDPYVSWGDICDDSLAGDDEPENNVEESYGKTTEVSIGNGGPSAWSGDEATSYSGRQSKRPNYLATGIGSSTSHESHDGRHSNGRRYSYSRRNRRPRSPCEGIGEQDLANARQARQLIISSPEKPIIKPEKWAREETKLYVKDQKVSFLFQPSHLEFF